MAQGNYYNKHDNCGRNEEVLQVHHNGVGDTFIITTVGENDIEKEEDDD